MPSDVKMWKRIELPAELHRELEREAKVVHMSTQAYAAYLLSRGLQRDRALAQIPFHARRNEVVGAAIEEAPAPAWTDGVEWHDGQYWPNEPIPGKA